MTQMSADQMLEWTLAKLAKNANQELGIGERHKGTEAQRHKGGES